MRCPAHLNRYQIVSLRLHKAFYKIRKKNSHDTILETLFRVYDGGMDINSEAAWDSFAKEMV
jgi:hypothetical protein